MNLQREKGLWKKGYKKVIGIDEAGRGPLAGPVLAAAVTIKKTKAKNSALRYLLREVKDSKKLTPIKRQILYGFLTKNSDMEWGTGKVSEKVIDKINILESTRLAMKRAVKNLEKKSNKKPDFLITDGNIKIDLATPQKSIIQGDNKVFSIAAASIIAKVTRDGIMKRYHKKYPQYRFDKHKGYPTKLHRTMIKKHGPCKIHRMTFRPIRSL